MAGDLSNEVFVCLLQGSGVAPRRRRRRAQAATERDTHAKTDRKAHNRDSESESESESDSDSEDDRERQRDRKRSQPSLSQQEDDEEPCYEDACIRVGADFQADIPPLLIDTDRGTLTESTCTERAGTVLWDPSRWRVRHTEGHTAGHAERGAESGSLSAYCSSALPVLSRRIAENAERQRLRAEDDAKSTAIYTPLTSSTPSPARGRSSKAAKALSAVEGTTIALRVLHCADYRAESALEQLRGAPSPRERDTPTDRERQAETPTDSASCNGAGAAPLTGIAELLQPHSIELGWWSGADCSRFISALRQRRREGKRRLGSPRQLMALSAQIGKSSGEVVGWYHWTKKTQHEDYAQRMRSALQLKTEK